MTKLKIKSEEIKSSPGSKNKLVKVHEDRLSINSFYATGKRKCSIARVWLKVGSGKITINKKVGEKYFFQETHIKSILQPFVMTKTTGQYDIICTVRGGGISGQMGAVLHGVSKALDQISPEFHTTLRKNGFLTRDSRVVERKKYGQHKARKKTQFSKR